MLAKKLVVDEHTLARGFRGFLSNSIHRKGKHVYWVVVAHFSAHGKDFPFRVRDFQDFLFSVAHYLLSILIACIFVVAGQERLWWLHYKFHVT